VGEMTVIRILFFSAGKQPYFRGVFPTVLLPVSVYHHSGRWFVHYIVIFLHDDDISCGLSIIFVLWRHLVSASLLYGWVCVLGAVCMRMGYQVGVHIHSSTVVVFYYNAFGPHHCLIILLLIKRWHAPRSVSGWSTDARLAATLQLRVIIFFFFFFFFYFIISSLLFLLAFACYAVVLICYVDYCTLYSQFG